MDRARPGMMRVRRPTPAPKPVQGAPAFRLDRPLKGLKVGLRYEPAWRSWTLIAQIWADWLRRDGAEPLMVAVGERTGADGEKTRQELEVWANSVDCAVSGIGT